MVKKVNSEELNNIRKIGSSSKIQTVLIVEDEDGVRLLAKDILELNGYAVMTAQNADEAIHIYKECRCLIDIMVTDVVMPQMSGAELTKKIREINPAVKVLYMSGYTDSDIVNQDIADTNAEFIQKPFTFNSILQKIQDLLNK